MGKHCHDFLSPFTISNTFPQVPVRRGANCNMGVCRCGPQRLAFRSKLPVKLWETLHEGIPITNKFYSFRLCLWNVKQCLVIFHPCKPDALLPQIPPRILSSVGASFEPSCVKTRWCVFSFCSKYILCFVNIYCVVLAWVASGATQNLSSPNYNEENM